MSEAYVIHWTDHYHFDLRRNGQRYLVDCEASLLGLVRANFPATTEDNDRPPATVWTYLKYVFG
jgi:hypothetical protein